MQFLSVSLLRSTLAVEPVISHLPPPWSLSVLHTPRAHYRQASIYTSIPLPPLLMLSLLTTPYTPPFCLCAPLPPSFFLNAHIYQIIWLPSVILYSRAVKELAEESENRRKGLVWDVGTTEYRINPGHSLEKETEKLSEEVIQKVR